MSYPWPVSQITAQMDEDLPYLKCRRAVYTYPLTRSQIPDLEKQSGVFRLAREESLLTMVLDEDVAQDCILGCAALDARNAQSVVPS